jgi:acetoin utilization protein AcuB
MGMPFTSLIEHGYPVFGIDEPAAGVLRKLVDAGLGSAPVVDDGQYVGIASVSALLRGRKAFPAPTRTLRTSNLAHIPAFGAEARVLESLGAAMAVDTEIIPIVDQEGMLEGVVPKLSILKAVATQFHVDDGGATIEIEAPPSGAKISEIVAAIEKNDAFVLAFSSKPFGSAGDARLLFFRVLTNDFFRLVRNLENYGYLVRDHSPFPDGGLDEMRERALEFIRYMDM